MRRLEREVLLHRHRHREHFWDHDHDQGQGRGQYPWSYPWSFPQFNSRVEGAVVDGEKKEKERRGLSLLLPEGYNATTPTSTEKNAMSILSIDMGIQNLGIAHLVVPCPDPNSTSALTENSTSNPDENQSGKDTNPLKVTPILNAWHRLKISDLPNPSHIPSEETAETTAGEEEKEPSSSFSLPLYASHAYTLITALLETYNPTHILIERQRFRSGGSSAVQEWTLRVGVFEGMVYAVIHTLREQRLQELLQQKGQQEGQDRGCGSLCLDQQGLSPPFVYSIEPQRVVRYWGDLAGFGSGGQEEEEGGEEGVSDASSVTQRKKMTTREVKKAKIDRVGRWLGAWQEMESRHSHTHTHDDTSIHDDDIHSSGYEYEYEHGYRDEYEPKLQISPNPHLRDLVNAYLHKWQKSKSRSSKKKKEKNPAEKQQPKPKPKQKQPKIGKLDDLADCLLQGVTWLDWQVMRHRISREGVGVVLSGGGMR